MTDYSLTHLSDHALLQGLAGLLAQDRLTTAAMLAHLAEVDERRLYLPAAYPSMYAWCVGELGLSEDAAFKRIRAARAARRFPAIYGAVADGRLNLSTVVLLVPYLAPETAADLLAAAARKSKSELELLLAERFPRPDLPAQVLALASPGPAAELALGSADQGRGAAPACESGEQLAPGPVVANLHKVAARQDEEPRARVAPLSAGRFAVQLTVGQETHEKLRYAQALLSHALPSGDLAQVLDRALDALIRDLERQRFAATARSRPRRRHGAQREPGERCVPAEVRRTVWQRDGGQCTYVSETGHRCPARRLLEFDHLDPVARGGRASAERMRLRCRAHNQYAAECAYGREFMRRRRESARRHAAQAREAREAARAREAAQEREAAQAREACEAAQAQADAARAREQEVIPWLRTLGFSATQARQGAARCEALGDAPLVERVKLALSSLAPPSARRTYACGLRSTEAAVARVASPG
jgi:5-methylcytosine-specific restriction endonuclease McrA